MEKRNTLTGGTSTRNNSLAQSLARVEREVRATKRLVEQVGNAGIEISRVRQTGVLMTASGVKIIISVEDLMDAMGADLKKLIARETVKKPVV